ncbi:MAG TPA: ABC transporter permease [Candidatus Salinicoccus stercoripullorum]|uniref:ABC transporter permease n=1 Tax=Candidatus Salinicoccus stercoripullorum TaxID=2838756 RepID=A0A9D1TYN3_9STAP|nr:ABC transporter permease [Candidatus Salinicoccus stercoripullorum]
MSKFMTTFLQTYISKIRAKSFIISTLIIVLLIFLAANIDKIIDFFDSSEEVTILQVDAEEAQYGAIESMFESMDAEFEIEPYEGGDAPSGGAVLTLEETDPMTFTVSAEHDLPDEQKTEIETALAEVQRMNTIQALKLTPEETASLGESPEISYDIAADKGETDDEGSAADMNPLNSIIFYVTVIIMFFIIINYASQIGTEIAMEKTSRVIEMIVSSVPPVTHLMAKISAMISVSLTQLIVFVLAVIAAIQMFDFNNLISEFGLESNDRTVTLAVYSLIYLILGLVLYLSVSALLGSFISRMEDLQQALLPVTMFSLIGFYIAIFNIWTSENMLVIISSYIPPFTPFVMPLRAMHETTGQVELLLGIVILIVTIAAVIWLAASIYRNSVLSTDKGILKNLKRIRRE